MVCRSGTNNMILPQNMCDLTVRPNSEETCPEFAGVVCLLDPVWIHGEWAEVQNPMCSVLHHASTGVCQRRLDTKPTS